MTKIAAFIELLEPRIAPASASVTYVDGDGDLVKITASKPGSTVPPLDMGDLTRAPSGQLQLLTLDAAFALCDIVFTVTKKPGGDGLADVGYIDATGFDLGKVTVKGDLGRIKVGNGDPASPAMKTLSVHSMGRYGTATQMAGGSLESAFAGAVTALKVARDIMGAALALDAGGFGSVLIGGSLIGGETLASGSIIGGGDFGPIVVKGEVIGGSGDLSGALGATGSVKSFTIGGSVRGGGGEFSGSLYGGVNGGSIGPVKIGGDLRGGGGKFSGALDATGVAVGKITIGGSMLGGTNSNAGWIKAGAATAGIKIGGSLIGGTVNEAANQMTGLAGAIEITGALGPVAIGGDFIGGPGNKSGLISAGTAAAGITVGGSMLGGSANVATGQMMSLSGAIEISGVLGPVKIGGDFQGGRMQGGGTFFGTGEINALRIASLTIGGSFVAGTKDGSGAFSRAGTVFAEGIGRVVIKGDLIGQPLNPARIQAFGLEASEPGLALSSLTVGGRVELAQILVNGTTPTNPNTAVGPVKVGGDWIASDLVSGVIANNNRFGDGDDAEQLPFASRIAAITIGGRILGSAGPGDHFGFVAHEIGAFRVGGVALARMPGVVDLPREYAFVTGDVTVREV